MRASLTKRDVEAVFLEKNSFATTYFLIRWRQNGLSYPRVAFAFARFSGKAVVRNRFKRRLREITKKVLTQTGLDLVIVAKKPLTPINNAVWLREVQKVMRFCEERLQSFRACPA